MAAAVVKAPIDGGINFHNRVAVRVSLLAAVATLLVIAFPLPPSVAVVRLLVCFLAAGFFAVYIYKRRTGQTVTVRGGARLGWMTGIFSFAILTVLGASALLMLSFFKQDLIGKDPVIDQAIRMLDDQGIIVELLTGLLVMFVVYTLLPMFGGALCAKVLEKD